MNNLKKTSIYLLFLFLTSHVFAQTADHKLRPSNKVKSNTLSELQNQSGSIAIIKSVDIQDQGNDYEDIFYNIYVRLESNTDDLSKPSLNENINLPCTLKIYGTDPISGAVTRTETPTLTISADAKEATAVYTFNRGLEYPYRLSEIDSVVVEISKTYFTPYSNSLLESLELELYTEYGRYYEPGKVEEIDIEIFRYDLTNSNIELKENEAMIVWDEQPEPCSYELEIIHIEDAESSTTDNWDYDFEKNAIRVQTEKNYFPINMLYSDGVIIVRGRSVRPVLSSDRSAILSQNKYSKWSLNNQGNIDSTSTAVLVIDRTANDVMNQVNWQLTSTYSNEGKKKDILSIYDGSYRSKQQVTKISDFNGTIQYGTDTSDIRAYNSTIVAKEAILNYEGNPIVDILPAPLVNSNVFGYQSGINLNNGNKIAKDDFDTTYAGTAFKIDSTSPGASKYYSDENPLLSGNNRNAKFIPDAYSFPYSKIEYLRDGSGRVKNQLAPGVNINDDVKNVRYAYAKPTRSDLEVLFGSNVGEAHFYKKNVSIDPNGVMSLAYIDKYDRTIATSIAGSANSSSKMVDLSSSSRIYEDDLLATGANYIDLNQGQFKFTYPLFVTVTSDYSFDYGFDVNAFMPCGSTSGVCYDCHYEFIFQIIDEDNKLILDVRNDNLSFDHVNCLADNFIPESINFSLDSSASIVNNKIEIDNLTGERTYTVIKELKLKLDEVQLDAEHYFDSSSCNFYTANDFVIQELDSTPFTLCETDYSDRFPCIEIKNELITDFEYPDGYFVKDAESNQLIADFILEKLMLVNGCENMINWGYADNQITVGDSLTIFQPNYTQFRSDFKQHFGLSQNPTFADYKSEYIDYFIQFHPTYCQYTNCLSLNNTNSLRFDAILEESDSIAEFLGLIKLLNDVNGTDSLYLDTSGVGFSTNLNSLYPDTTLLAFDSTLHLLLTEGSDSIDMNYLQFSIENFNAKGLSGFFSGGMAYRVFDHCGAYGSQNVYGAYVLSNSEIITIVNSYFTDYFGCGTSPADIGINDLSLEIGQDNDAKWKLFKEFYQKVKKKVYEQFLLATLCSHDQYCGGKIQYAFSKVSTGEGEGDSTLVLDSIYVDSIYINPHLDAQNYLDSSSYYVGIPRDREIYEIDTSDPNTLIDSVQDLALADTSMGKEVYRLLLSYKDTAGNVCIDAIDSMSFVDNFVISQFLCNPFSYLNTNKTTLGLSSTCDPYQINLASFINPYLQYFKDTLGNDLFDCSRPLPARYNCYTFDQKVTDFSTEFGSSALPSLNSFDDISLYNTSQVKFTNWMNYELGLNLSFTDYYFMAESCVDHDETTIFGDTVKWEQDTGKIAAIKQEVVDYNNLSTTSFFRNLNESKIFDTINDALNGTYTTSITTDYFGFGEEDHSDSQYDLFYVPDVRGKYDTLLDLFNAVFTTIKSDLNSIENFEENVLVNCEKIEVNQNVAVQGYTNLKIDRTYRHSDGTIWVRLINASDGSFYDDFYYHYQPFNFLYLINEIDSFNSIRPIFDQESMHYVDLSVNNTSIELLASTTNEIAYAYRVGQVELAEPLGSGEFPIDQGCEGLMYESAKIMAQVKYEAYREQKVDSFKLEYKQFCLNQKQEKALTNEQLIMSYTSSEKHFTLYYYDRAGNLVKTVPPGGIDTNFTYNSTVKGQIDNYRNGSSNTQVLPNHIKETTYKYNSDNQLIEQHTPNGGGSHFWYDKLGRLVLSRNESQKYTDAFSYTFYDENSRITEAGEVILPEFYQLGWSPIHAAIFTGIIDGNIQSLEALIESKLRTDVVKTYYDEKKLINGPSDFNQNNLRSRVAAQAIYSKFSSSTTETNWDFANHYSYDATGNVTTLLNDYYQAGDISNVNQRFKQVDYSFDVISGNVLAVYYQLGKEDAFYHRYEYDAENRITQVNTSKDGVIWDNDANYEYYLHGPLARTELGEYKVQGIDYVYTLQGWLKSVNGSHMGEDMGQDDEKGYLAKDAFGYSLLYNENDYKSIESSASNLANIGSNYAQLYNGNISAIAYHNQEQNFGKSYLYDQLNRIKTMNEDSTLLTSLSLQTKVGGYNSYYEYDPNGNITQLNRYDGDQNKQMDYMSYQYNSETDQLLSVDDTVAAGTFSNDIDQQLTGNYSYDRIGNLISDTANNICQIKWYPNGKVKRIIRFETSKESPNLYFDYDAMGNRVKKIVNFNENDTSYFRTTYYSRDAQGNVLATYEEKDCAYYLGDDTTGIYYYQFSDNYTHYTNLAIQQLNLDSLLNFLSTGFSEKEMMLNEAADNLNQITGIRDTIFECLNLVEYIDLYPLAVHRLFTYDVYPYANELYTNQFSDFFDIANYQGETWITYLQDSSKVQDFYNNYASLYASELTTAQQDSNRTVFYLLQQDILDSILAVNTTLFKDLLGLDASQFEVVNDVYGGSSNLVETLGDLFDDLKTELENETDDATVTDLLKKINGIILLMGLSDEELNDIFDGYDLELLTSSLSWLTGSRDDLLNAILYHLYILDEQVNSNIEIDIEDLLTYDPMASIDWSKDTNGDLLIYFLHSSHAPSEIRYAASRYFSSLNLGAVSLYFNTNDTIALNYVKESFLNNYAIDSTLTNVVITLDSLSLAYLYAIEDIEYLINYYKVKRPIKTLRQNYLYDSLQTALSGIGHYTPYDYAKELELYFGIDLGNITACNDDRIVLVPSKFNIYGSSRLGQTDAKEGNKQEENVYARKLRNKSYELSDHLGNVVATISDKKMHPQDLNVYGQVAVDTSLGFQADVTGRYDYYPFGMEIMERSGDFELIDYEQSSNELIYEGLLEDCSDYWKHSGTGGVVLQKNCNIDTNIFNETYISSLSIDFDTTYYRDQMYFWFDTKPITIFEEIDSTATYKIELHFSNTQDRNCSGYIRGGDNEEVVYGLSIEQGLHLPHTAIRGENKKVIILEYTGAELLNKIAGTEDLWFRLHFSAASGPNIPEYGWINLDKIKAFKVVDHSNTQMAMRSSEAYQYGFQGQERDDEMKGSGNSYDFGARMYYSRLGRWFKTDAFEVKYPSLSPYNFVANNPIVNVDIGGDSIWTTVETSTLDDGTELITRTIHTTIAVLNTSDDDLDMKKIVNDFKSKLETALYENEAVGAAPETKINYRSDVQVRQVKDMTEVNNSDHLIVIVDDVNDRNMNNTSGLALLKGKIAYAESVSWFGRGVSDVVVTMIHEWGHNAGLDHWFGFPDNYMDYGDGRDKFNSAQRNIIFFGAQNGDLNQGDNFENIKSDSYNLFWNSSSNTDPWDFNVEKGDKTPKRVFQKD